MAKYLAQIVFLSAQVVGRAFSRALRQEFAASQSAANQRRTNTGTNDRGINLKIGLNLEEAMQILNLRHQELNPEVIESNYKHLFEINDKSKGGSFYLQSKVFRAKERVEEELHRMYSTSDRKTQKKDPFPD